MTKRVLLVAAVVCLTVAPAWSETWQRWNGVVAVPTVDAPGEKPLRAARCAYLLRGEGSNAVLGFVIEIPPALADGTHPFRLLDGRMSAFDGLIADPADFDVAFYRDLGSCETLDEPYPVRFNGPGDEHGLVPDGARYALVTVANKPESGFEFEIRLD